MSTPCTPSEIARETLRQLALRRIPPTPENYLRLYNEIAATDATHELVPKDFLQALSKNLPRDTSTRQKAAQQFDQALDTPNGDAARAALLAYLGTLKLEQSLAWNKLIPGLLRSWDARQQGWTTARKRDALDRVLVANDPSTLFTRLQGLVRAWEETVTDEHRHIDPALTDCSATTGENAVPSASAAAVSSPSQADAGQRNALMDGPATLEPYLRQLLARSLRSILPSFLGAHPELSDESEQIALQVENARDQQQLEQVGDRIRQFSHRVEMLTADDAEVRAGLQELLALLLRNIDELVLDDKWLNGQIEMLQEFVDSPPNPRRLDDAGRRLKDLIFKQSQLKHDLLQSQQNLRSMLAGFVDQLARFSESTSSYHDKISVYAQRIASADEISQIVPLLNDVMRETRSIQDEAQCSRNELISARKQAQVAAEQISRLQQELEDASRMMRHDQLTGALNRRGLEENFQAERARAQRRNTRLALALLDIDNFKKLNDSFGHQAGDKALVHLASVVRQHLRPQDVLARYGGEEFVILLPETEQDEAYQVLTRLQRQLTREFFMAGQQRLVITFSAGVTLVANDDSIQPVLERADRAMYQAKQAGRNRVMLTAAAS